jgi:UDP-GlcNAc:undecaprenyl-phosphate/decaprenyl-phosphate GlcNAc-1-phosphate transferase
VTSQTLATAVGAGLATAAAARLAYRALTRFPPGGEKAWARVNHRGEPVTLLEGPAAVAGAVAASAAAGILFAPATERACPGRLPLILSVAGTGAGAFGVLDDLKGSGKRRGLRGHLGALGHGEVTTGTVKLAGIGATAVAGAFLVRRTEPSPVDRAIDAGLIAGGANLLNLFDLRPGRAIKVATLSAGLISLISASTASASTAPRGAGVAAVAVPVGAALAVLPDDLAERAMLGDGGANALGAMLGAAAAATLPRPARIGLLAVIVALTGISEKVSFTKVIARTPMLNWLDMLGRRPASQGGSTSQGGFAAPSTPQRGETPLSPPFPEDGRKPPAPRGDRTSAGEAGEASPGPRPA